MGNPKKIGLLALICVLLVLAPPVFAADGDPWYVGQVISRFVNHGLVNVKQSTIEDIEFNYQGKVFTDDLYNQLQADLYATNSFLYFLADAQRATDGSDALVLDITFYELPVVKTLTFTGNENMKDSKIRDALSLKEGDFVQKQAVEASRLAILDLYHTNGFSEATVTADQKDDEEGNSSSITYTIVEGPQKKVQEVVFEGNEHIASQTLKKQLTTKTSSYFTAGYFQEANIQKDKDALVAFYLNNGYVDGAITDVKVETLPAEDEKDKYQHLRITYVISEGQQWKFGGVITDGNTIFSDEELQKNVTLAVGDVINKEKVESIISAIADEYWNNGYVHNNIVPEMQRDEKNHVITYLLHITEAPQATISEIRLEGLTKTKPYVFMREMAFKVGDVFSKAKLQKSAQNIYNTLIVTDVQVNVIDGTEENTVIPIFTVTEGNQMSVQFGATFGGTVDSFPISGFVQWSDKNVAGTGRDLSISTTLSPDTQEAEISFGDDWVGDKRWSNNVSLSFSRVSKTNGLQRGGSKYYTGHDSDDFYQAYPLGYGSYTAYLAADQANPMSRYLMSYDYLRIAVGYNSGYTFMFDAGSLTLGGGLSIGLNRAFYDETLYDPFEYLMTKYHEKWQFSNKLSFTATWDGRDLKENTTKGYVISNQFSYAGGILGGLSNYLKNTTSFSWYRSLFTYKLGEKDANVVLGSTTTVSWMLPQFWNNTDDYYGVGTGWNWYDPKIGATRYEMLYIDGMNTGRGFSVLYDQSFLWDNQLSIGAPLVSGVLNWEVYASATAVTSTYDEALTQGFSALNWYFSMGAGIKLKIPGFPLGLYLVKNAKWLSGSDPTWVGGSIFANSNENSGLKLVLAITQTIY